MKELIEKLVGKMIERGYVDLNISHPGEAADVYKANVRKISKVILDNIVEKVIISLVSV